LSGRGAPRYSAKLFLNVDGLGADAFVRVEVLDRLGRDLSGHRAEVRMPGLHVPVPLPATSAAAPVRLRVRFLGKESAKIKFYAAYLE
jgi:hypothetical protein